MTHRDTPRELPPDNAARVAIFDAMFDARREGARALTFDELYKRVIPRLRVLVPRELHNAGEPTYLHEKVETCVQAGLLARTSDPDERFMLTDRPPRVRYPNDEIRDYTAGLELARERLDIDNAKLRDTHFDVSELVPSPARAPDSPAFRTLVASMREHGFLKHAPVLARPESDVILDGRARVAAAAEAGVDVVYFSYGTSPAERAYARRRDTPLHRILIYLDSNTARLSDDDRTLVHDAVASVTGRSWEEIEADLKLSRAWRGARSRPYLPLFETQRLAYRPGGEPRIHVTNADDKVLARSLVVAAGLAPAKVDDLNDYVAFEMARSDQPGGGPRGKFARADHLLAGIEKMLADRRNANRKMKIDPEWDEISTWLRGTFSINETQPTAG